MRRENVVTIDCAKLRQRLLVDCGFSVATASDKTNIPHSVLHRMLGGARRAPERRTNVTIVNINLAIREIRKALKLADADFGLEDLLWAEAEGAGEQAKVRPGPNETFEVLLGDALAFHTAAMSNRDLAVRVYGQALTPLDPGSPRPVARTEFLEAFEDAFRITTPVRLADSIQTEVTGAPILVQGDEGVGKTWLVAQWWWARRADVLLLYLPASRFRAVDVKPGDVVLEELRAMVSKSRLEAAGADAAWRSAFQSREFEQAARGRMILMIDGVNEAPDADWPAVLEVLWSEAQRLGARLVLTCRPGFWRRRERELASGPWQHLATVTLLGFTPDEFEQACRMAGHDPALIPADLVTRLGNPRVFRLAMTLLPTLRRHADFGIDRLLYAYWGSRQDERADLRRLDPDRDVFLQGLARHAEAFHERRLQEARARARDLEAEDVAFDVDDVGTRFRGLDRYRPTDSVAAATLLGEIREGRFFDDDPLAPGGSYVFRKGALAFALGVYLVKALMDRVREQRSQLDPDALRERLATLLEPVLDFDQTADQLMAALTTACLDPVVVPLVRTLLLEQFLELRNRPSQLKSVLAALALEAPDTFCDVAERLSQDAGAERIDTWLIAALRYMVEAGICLERVRNWIASPTDEEAGLLWRTWPQVADEAVARQRQTLAAMVAAGQALAPFATALFDLGRIASDRPPSEGRREPRPSFSQTPLAQVVRFNDRDPEALIQAILICESAGSATHAEAARRTSAALLALIASDEALLHARERASEMMERVDPPEEMPRPPWFAASDPTVDPAALAADFRLAEKLMQLEGLDPLDPNGEALLAVAARCDPGKFKDLARAEFDKLLSAGPPTRSDARAGVGSPGRYGSRSKSLAVLAETCASALGQDRFVTLAEAKVAQKVVFGSQTRVASDVAQEREQVLATLLATTSEKSRRGLLRAVRRSIGIRQHARPPIWRPELSAEVIIAAIRDVASDWESAAPARQVEAREFLSFLADFPVDAKAEPEVEPLVILGLGPSRHPASAYETNVQAALNVASHIDPVRTGQLVLEHGWTWASADAASDARAISAMVVQGLAGQVPLETYAARVCPADLPLAAADVPEDELPTLIDLIEHELAANGSNAFVPPSRTGAARMAGVRTDWIAAHLAWHTRAIGRMIEGSHPTADEFTAAAILGSAEPIEGERDYIGALLRHGRISRDGSSQRVLAPALAVAGRSPSPADILDRLVFRITDDRILAALAHAARDLGSTTLATFDAYVEGLSASRTTIRAAYGITLCALRGRIDERPRAGFLQVVADHGREIASANEHAHHWAQRRFSDNDAGAEHLALATMSAPFPGSFDRLALPASAGALENLFLRRLVEKAENWGYDTLFGQPSPPKWLFAQMPES